jgi:DNA invertase Pin-like site-specific DNA recombinase
MADTLLHGTHKHGQKNPNARLTNEQAQALRELALAEVAPQSELAARFGVSQQVVSRIKRGEAYRNAQLVAAIKAQEAEKRAGK